MDTEIGERLEGGGNSTTMSSNLGHGPGHAPIELGNIRRPSVRFMFEFICNCTVDLSHLIESFLNVVGNSTQDLQDVLRSPVAPYPRSCCSRHCDELNGTKIMKLRTEQQRLHREARPWGPHLLQGACNYPFTLGMTRRVLIRDCEQGNLTNLHSFKYSGLANAKVCCFTLFWIVWYKQFKN